MEEARSDAALVISVVVFLAVAFVMSLVGACMSPGGNVVIPTEVKQMSTLQGEGEIGAVFIGGYAFTYPIRWRGSGSMTLQYPQTPHILLKGSLVWEPVVPGQLPAIQAEIAAGRFRVEGN